MEQQEEFHKKMRLSFSEWFREFGLTDSYKLLQEDKTKEERLTFLNEYIGLPIFEPSVFLLTDISENAPRFREFRKENRNGIFNLRLIPFDNTRPLLRVKNVTITNALSWLGRQNIKNNQYTLLFKPFISDVRWSTIFIINKRGVSGEITKGFSLKLTVGFYDDQPPITFFYDYKKWKFSENNQAAENFARKAIGFLLVKNGKTQIFLKTKLQTAFIRDYLTGYFECVNTPDSGFIFADFNRVIGRLYCDFSINCERDKNDVLLTGRGASLGVVTGKVKIIDLRQLNQKPVDIMSDEILVCEATTPDYVYLMKKAGGIVTERGGILCHAAIVSREFKKPCVVNVEGATKVLRNGDTIQVDATRGFIKKLP